MDRALYDDDFYAWTQEQAELLRQGSAASNRLDFELIAEEIEDLGKSELHTVQSLSERIIEHLLKLEYAGLAEPVRHVLPRLALRLRKTQQQVGGKLLAEAVRGQVLLNHRVRRRSLVGLGRAGRNQREDGRDHHPPSARAHN